MKLGRIKLILLKRSLKVVKVLITNLKHIRNLLKKLIDKLEGTEFPD